jgi:hypothetical protein
MNGFKRRAEDEDMTVLVAGTMVRREASRPKLEDKRGRFKPKDLADCNKAAIATAENFMEESASTRKGKKK